MRLALTLLQLLAGVIVCAFGSAFCLTLYMAISRRSDPIGVALACGVAGVAIWALWGVRLVRRHKTTLN